MADFAPTLARHRDPKDGLHPLRLSLERVVAWGNRLFYHLLSTNPLT